MMVVLSSNHALGNHENRVPIYGNSNAPNSQSFNGFRTLELLKDPGIKKYTCTRSIKIYILTESGIFGFGLSITARTCEEANTGISNAVKGFIKGIY